LRYCSKDTFKISQYFLAAALFCGTAVCQTSHIAPRIAEVDPAINTETPFDVSNFAPGTFDEATGDTAVQKDSSHSRFVSRMVKRGLEDQKELYLAPFKPSNFKWDAVVLAGTAGLLIADRHIENSLPGGNHTLYQTSSDIAIAGLGATLGSVWIYGIKTDHPHAKELGGLELETLINTFLIYTPMQLIAGRQRPGEGNGHGDFLRHHAMNTSFPGGHAMFAWAMATVAADEYPNFWVRTGAYTAALAVTVGRFLGRDHWSSDMLVGTALGIGIGTHVFHSHCDPELSDGCKHHHNKVEYRADRKSQGLRPQ
jgi:hypothetical protein